VQLTQQQLEAEMNATLGEGGSSPKKQFSKNVRERSQGLGSLCDEQLARLDFEAACFMILAGILTR